MFTLNAFFQVPELRRALWPGAYPSCLEKGLECTAEGVEAPRRPGELWKTWFWVCFIAHLVGLLDVKEVMFSLKGAIQALPL